MPIRKINSRAIGTNVILAEDIDANAVTTAEIQDAAVTPSKLALSTAFDFANDLKGSGGIVENFQAAGFNSGVLTLDFNNGNNFYHNFGGNASGDSITSIDLTNVPAPDNTPNTGDGTAFFFTLKLKQPASGTLQTISWVSNPTTDHEFYWAGGSSNAPTITNTLGAHDLFGFYTHDGGSTIYSFKLGQDLK